MGAKKATFPSTVVAWTGHTSVEFAAVENCRLAIGISMFSVTVPEIIAFPVRRPRCYFRLSISVTSIWKYVVQVVENEDKRYSI